MTSTGREAGVSRGRETGGAGTAGEQARRGAPPRRRRRPISGTLPGVAALAAAAAGVWLISTGSRNGLSGGILLLVVALAGGAVALGGASYGPSVEGRLDLSGRLALGFLGGGLAAAVVLAAEVVLGGLGVHAAFGVSFPSVSAPGAIGVRLAQGSVWGMVFGILLPFLPKGRLLMRGALFSIIPSLYVLLKVFPLDLGAGLLGLEFGPLAFVFVLLYNLLWGLLTARLFHWGQRTDEAPLSRPLGGE